MNDSLRALLGFARKSNNIELGFEAVRRGILKGKIGLILVDEELSKNSFKKIVSLGRKNDIQIFLVNTQEEKTVKLDMPNYKILGLHHGGLLKGFIEKLNQESK